jgi:hypothetical protein
MDDGASFLHKSSLAPSALPQPAPPAAIIRKRLAVNETFLATFGPKKIAQEYFAVINGLQNKSQEDAQKLVEKFLSTLAQYEAQIRKQQIVQTRCGEELQYYVSIHTETTKQIEQARSDIQRLKEELVLAQKERGHKAMYEEVARAVNKHPTRDDLQAAIAAVQEEYVAAQAERAAVDAKLEFRKAQFALIFSAIDDVGAAIREEAEAEAAHSAQRQAAKRHAAGAAPGAEDMAEEDTRAGREAGDEEEAPAGGASGEGEGSEEEGVEGQGEGAGQGTEDATGQVEAAAQGAEGAVQDAMEEEQTGTPAGGGAPVRATAKAGGQSEEGEL